jgi:hypothetical protein
MMAHRIQAISAYRPKIDYGDQIDSKRLAEHIQGRTTLSRADVEAVLRELSEAIIFFSTNGNTVKLDGVATFRPEISLDGRFDVNTWLDPAIRKAINVQGAFTGTLINAPNIGMRREDLDALWNAEHPDDPVEDRVPE